MRSSAWFSALYVAVCVCLCACPSRAMIGGYTDHVGYGERLSALWSFEFAAGGTLDMSVELSAFDTTNSSLQLLWMTDTQIALMAEQTDSSQWCTTPPTPYALTPTLQVLTLGDPQGGWSLSGRIAGNSVANTTGGVFVAPSRDWYRVVSLNCDAANFDVTLTFTAVNPGGEYLSLSDVPYKTLYVVCCIGWAALLAVWCTNWFRYRFWNVRLQRALTLVPASKLLFSILLLYFWRECSRTGRSPVGLFWGSFVFVSLSRTLFFGALMVVGRGWSITRANLTGEWNKLATILFFLLIAQALYTFYGGFVLFLLLILYIVVLRATFAGIAENAAALTAQLSLIRRSLPQLDVSSTPVWSKLHLFKRFQIALVMFVSVEVITELWATIFLRETPWVADCLEHILTGLMCLGVGYTFRLRPFNPYFFRVSSGAAPAHIPIAAAGAPPALARAPSDGPVIDSAMLLAAHSAATAAARSSGASAAASGSSAAGHGDAVAAHQPLIGADALELGPVSRATGDARPSPLQRWTPGMPLPALPAPGSWVTEEAANGSGGSDGGAPIIIVQNPFSDQTNTDVVLARPAYESPTPVLPAANAAAGAGAGAGAGMQFVPIARVQSNPRAGGAPGAGTIVLMPPDAEPGSASEAPNMWIIEGR